jgi:hypothetical protein
MFAIRVTCSRSHSQCKGNSPEKVWKQFLRNPNHALIVSWYRVEDFKKQNKNRPQEVLSCLLGSSITPPSMKSTTIHQSMAVFLKTSLIRSATGTPNVRVTVFARKPGNTHSLISPFSSFPEVHTNRDWHTETEKHPLSPVLSFLLRDNAKLAQMERDLKEGPSSQPLATLLKRFEAPRSLREAPQPPGFTEGIRLHDYQRCVPFLPCWPPSQFSMSLCTVRLDFCCGRPLM